MSLSSLKNSQLTIAVKERGCLKPNPLRGRDFLHFFCISLKPRPKRVILKVMFHSATVAFPNVGEHE